MKSYTDIEQSKKLVEILPIETADMCFYSDGTAIKIDDKPYTVRYPMWKDHVKVIPCWSLAALLNYLSEIKMQVYTPILFPSESKWILQFVEYGNGNICEVSYNNPIDACYEMIIKLHKFNLL